MLPDGSESLFYNFFLPRVLPIVPLEPLFLIAPQIPILLVYGGENDWVDRTGAQKMAKRFPAMVSLVDIPGITHNIALHTVQCKELFQQLFR
jgi:pimeloyl-ACP methyl ester carboxylesterase